MDTTVLAVILSSSHNDISQRKLSWSWDMTSKSKRSQTSRAPVRYKYHCFYYLSRIHCFSHASSTVYSFCSETTAAIMSGANRQYWTPDGEPPNGGLPPGYRLPIMAPQLPQFVIAPAAPSFSPPAYGIPHYPPDPITEMFLPRQAAFQPPTQALAPIPSPSKIPYPCPGRAKYNQQSPDFEKANRTHFMITFQLHLDLSRPVRSREIGFEIWSVPSGFPVGQLIRDMGAPQDSHSKYGITELRELGDGWFEEGQSIFLNSDPARKSLRDVGWDSNRGTTAMPVRIKICRKT